MVDAIDHAYECGTRHVFYKSEEDEVYESKDCLRNQLTQANERLTALLNESMDKAEAKIGTRPAHVVVEELGRKYAGLVEACENLRDVEQSDEAQGGEMYYAEAMGPAVERVVEVLERLGGDTDA
ncbi:MAG TPA: hypothetical protein VK054_06955, partial [Beutenbergiaceae bacterium]|nr:hypothetical protein [Beutenbergiaceae bacterium]